MLSVALPLLNTLLHIIMVKVFVVLHTQQYSLKINLKTDSPDRALYDSSTQPRDYNRTFG